MDTALAFMMGEAHRHDPLMVFDWDTAARIIAEKSPKFAVAGLEGDFEYTSGVIWKDGKPYLHLHITASRSDYSCIGGHLLEAYINGACELYVEAFPGVKIGRYQDPETGLNLYEF